jgi:YHS domain-containing protein
MKARCVLSVLAGVALLSLIAVGASLVSPAVAAEDAKDPLAAAKCPVSGKAVKAESTADHNGGKVYFCCDNCPKAFAKNPAKFAAKANQQLLLTGQAKQAKCPLAGRPINPATAIDVAGTKVAFCCNNCKGAVGKLAGDAQLEKVFSDAAFKKGFVVGKEEKK